MDVSDLKAEKRLRVQVGTQSEGHGGGENFVENVMIFNLVFTDRKGQKHFLW